VEVSFVEWTRDGLLRHPEFVGGREDKRPTEIRRTRDGRCNSRSTVCVKPGHTEGRADPPCIAGTITLLRCLGLMVTGIVTSFW
jgi:hypothetical protein